MIGPAPRSRLRGLWAGAGQVVRREPFLAAVSLLALFYVAASLSPSGYALVLRSFGVADDGLIFGWPQFIRSDEYSIWTPTLQAVVASDFGPVNVTSLYAERFRSLSALPLADWGLFFKPEFWAFFVISPARAFSAYHAFHFWAFLVGWVLFLRQLGIGRSEAALASLLLVGSAWAQIWWTSLAPILVFAPLFVLPLLLPLRAWQRSLAAFYVTMVWLLDGIFYPPLYLASSLAVGLAILAFRPDVLRPARLAAWAGGVCAGIGLAAFYHWDSIVAMAGSSMHGARNLGGGAVPWQDYLGSFLPSFPYHGWNVLFGSNSCESSAAGSILWPLILFFALPPVRRGAPGPGDGHLLLRAAGLAGYFLVATLWLLAPVPAIWGKLLLWHLTPPTRLLLLPGLLSLFLALLILPRLELRWSALRAGLFSLLVLGLWAYSEGPMLGAPHRTSWLGQIHLHADLALIPLAFALPLLEWARRRFLPPSGSPPDTGGRGEPASWRRLSPAALLAAAAGANLFFFGLYNPIQSSQPIFARHESAELRALQAMQDADPRGWLVVGGGGYFGSVLNGLGFRSVNHALPNPEVARFARFFPQLPAEELNHIFNRYVNVQVSSYTPPGWSAPLQAPMLPVDNGVLVPPEAFLPPLSIRLIAAPPSPLPAAAGGSTRALPAGPEEWQLEVEGPIAGGSGEVAIEIHTDPPARGLSGSWRMPPPDGTERLGPELYSRLQVELAASGPLPPAGLGWCVVLHDPVAGSRQIGPGPGQGRSTCRGAAEREGVIPDARAGASAAPARPSPASPPRPAG